VKSPKHLFGDLIESRVNRPAGTRPSRGEAYVPITRQMRVATAVVSGSLLPAAVVSLYPCRLSTRSFGRSAACAFSDATS
jgi:hypothetical protein